MPFLSIIYVARNATPCYYPYSHKQPNDLDIYFVMSDNNGISIYPNPPYLRLFIVYSICEYFESTEHAITSHPVYLNYLALFPNAIISVGHTNVKSNG